MAVKSISAKHKEALLQLRGVWQWLRELPEYKNDYADLNKISEGYLRKKWGFFPLTDPKEKHYGFLSDALSILGKDFTGGYLNIESGANWLPFLYRTKIGIVDSWGKKHKFEDLPNLPERIIISFDPRLPSGALKTEFIREVKHIQSLYRIKPKRIRYDSFKTHYITYVGLRLGWTQAKIRRKIRGVDKDDPRQGGMADAWRHRVKRSVKKGAHK